MIKGNPYEEIGKYIDRIAAEPIPVDYSRIELYDELASFLRVSKMRKELVQVCTEEFNITKSAGSKSTLSLNSEMSQVMISTCLIDRFWEFFNHGCPLHFLPRPDDYDFSKNFIQTPYWVALFGTKLEIPPPPTEDVCLSGFSDSVLIVVER